MKTIIYSATILFSTVLAAWSCDEFKANTTDELKEYRAKLTEADADPFDRLFAFQALACDANPVIRAFAIRAGMESAKDPIVRQQIVFDAFMGMTRVDIQMRGAELRDAKNFFQSNAGTLSLSVRHRDKKRGCLGLARNDDCEGWFVQIDGDKILLEGNGFDGAFRIAETNQVIGYVRRSGEKIPSTIDLF